jgi:hypothetical protein
MILINALTLLVIPAFAKKCEDQALEFLIKPRAREDLTAAR